MICCYCSWISWQTIAASYSLSQLLEKKFRCGSQYFILPYSHFPLSRVAHQRWLYLPHNSYQVTFDLATEFALFSDLPNRQQSLYWLSYFVTHPIWSLQLRFLVAKPNEGRNSNAVKHPGRKTEVIYERFKATGVWQQHDPGNDTLTKSNAGKT